MTPPEIGIRPLTYFELPLLRETQGDVWAARALTHKGAVQYRVKNEPEWAFVPIYRSRYHPYEINPKYTTTHHSVRRVLRRFGASNIELRVVEGITPHERDGLRVCREELESMGYVMDHATEWGVTTCHG